MREESVLQFLGLASRGVPWARQQRAVLVVLPKMDVVDGMLKCALDVVGALRSGKPAGVAAVQYQ
jgi:hypothetical protein